MNNNSYLITIDIYHSDGDVFIFSYIDDLFMIVTILVNFINSIDLVSFAPPLCDM